MTIDPTSGVARRLDRSYLVDTPDSLLGTAALFAEDFIGLGVALLVGGVVMQGQLTRRETFAAHVDAAVEEHVSTFGLLEGDDLAEARAAILTAFSTMTERHRELERAGRSVREKYTPDNTIDDYAAEDVAAVLRTTLPAPYVHLTNASVQIGEQLRDVGAIRVRASAVSAWWPLASETGVSLSYNVPDED